MAEKIKVSTGNWQKIVGSILIFLSIPTCMVGQQGIAGNIGVGMAVVGFILFILGRMLQ